MSDAKTILIIFGPFRSGTSLAAAMCHRMGYDFGPEEGFSPRADRFNPTGYFQRADVVHANEALLNESPGGLYGDAPLFELSEEARNAALGPVDFDWMENKAKVALKDPRFCLTLPQWLHSPLWGEREIRLLRVHRNTQAVAASAAKHRFVGAYTDYSIEKSRRLAENLDQASHRLCTELPYESETLDFDKLIESPVRETERLAAFLGVSERNARDAAALVGKNRALLSHYLRKGARPREILESIRKTSHRFLHLRSPS